MSSTATQLDHREELFLRLVDARAITDGLFQLVREESLYDRPIPERHRIVFYIGHLEAFDWNLIVGHALGLPSDHEQLDRLFAFGIDPVGGGLPSDQPADWPRLGEIAAYNLSVREKLDRILEGGAQVPVGGWRYPREAILNTAIEHRLMHAETLAYMLHQLPLAAKIAPRDYRMLAATPPARRAAAPAVNIPAGIATLGIPPGQGLFGWDNEFAAHTVQVPAFAIDACKVTNGEYLKFVEQGGYQHPRFWSEPGWAWINEQNISHPRFWLEDRGVWFYRGMFESVPLPLDWPVYVSYAEAAAYARFVNKCLPTEAQFHRAAYGSPEGVERDYPWGDEAPDAQRGNFNFQRWDPAAVGSYPAGRSAFGIEDALGNGWEWTSSIFAPFSGFEPFPFYPGYSSNFFDGKHYVMKGASPRTAVCMLRRSFRNWFQPHYQYAYASFRCVSE